MNRLRSKLRSKRGASITFALLIFLVCAVVSSVVIVAATTAGGTMSGLRENDQRYYAATEAAHKLKNDFVSNGEGGYLEGITVILPYTDATAEDDDETSEGDELTTNDSPARTITYQDIISANIDSTSAIAKKASVAAVMRSLMDQGIMTTQEIKLDDYTMTPSEDSVYSCLINQSLENGLLSFTIVASGGTRPDAFKLSIRFTPNVQFHEADEAHEYPYAVVNWSLHSLSR